MRIGIDIDGVLTDIEAFMIDYGSKFCVDNNLPLNINPGHYDDVKMFGWTDEQAVEFWRTYIIKYFTEYPVRYFAKEVIKKLKEFSIKIKLMLIRKLLLR